MADNDSSHMRLAVSYKFGTYAVLPSRDHYRVNTGKTTVAIIVATIAAPFVARVNTKFRGLFLM